MTIFELFRTAIANTFRSKTRLTLTVLALFIGAFSLTLTSATGAGISRYIDSQVASIGSSDVLSVVKSSSSTINSDGSPAEWDPDSAVTSGGATDVFVSPLTDSDVDVIEATEGVERVTPAIQVSPSYIERGSSGRFQVTVNAAAPITNADLAAGAQLASVEDEQLLLPTTYLGSLGFDSAEAAVGQTVTIGVADYLGDISEVDATVVGVQNRTLLGAGIGLNGHLTATLSAIEATGRPANIAVGYVAAAAYVESGSTAADIDAIKSRLSAEGYRAQSVSDQIGAFQTAIAVIVGVLNAFAVIALIAAGLGIVNTLLMSVQERTREIGLMKAMGMGARRIFALFSAEAVFIGLLGSALGVAVAVGIGTVLNYALAATVFSGLPGLSVMYFDPRTLVVIVLVVMLIAFLAGTLPARRAGRQNPIDALRYE